MSKGMYGRAISTDMRAQLSWQAIYLLDCFQGIWRTPHASVRVSNGKLSAEFGWSIGTTKRALTQLEEQGYIRRIKTDEGHRVIVPGGTIIQGKESSKESEEVDQERSGGGSQEIRGWIKPDPRVDHQRSEGGSEEIHIKPINLKPSNLKQEREGGELVPVRAGALGPPKKSKFDLKSSISREGYQELLTRSDLANGDRAWLFSQIESMQDWSANGHLKQDWLATARNWLKRARRSGDIPHGAAPPRHQPKTFKQIEQDEFDDAVNGFLRNAE